MPIEPSKVAVGKCYVTANFRVCRVLDISRGRVKYESRSSKAVKGRWPSQKHRPIAVEEFARKVLKEVPAHYDPDYPTSE